MDGKFLQHNRLIAGLFKFPRSLKPNRKELVELTSKRVTILKYLQESDCQFTGNSNRGLKVNVIHVLM